MNQYGGYRRNEFPTEFNYQSNSFNPVRPRTREGGIYRLQKKKKSRKRFYGLMTTLVILFALFNLWGGDTKKEAVSDAKQEKLVEATLGESTSFSSTVNASETVVASAEPVSPESKPSASLEQAVLSQLEGTKGDYGFYIKNLKTGESYFNNEHKQYQPGSLYKLWVMGAVFKEIEKGSLKEDEELSKSIPYLNSRFGISAANAEQTKGGISLTVAEALHQMITISHNYAAMLLTDEIKLSTVGSYIKAQGFSESQVGTASEDPLTTPFDIGMYYEKLYNDQLNTHESNQKMIELLKKQQKKNKLPYYLAEDVVMAHKTGELGMFSHDAGIVYTPKGDYIIVAFSESESPKGAEDRIALVSKAVYEYFISK